MDDVTRDESKCACEHENDRRTIIIDDYNRGYGQVRNFPNERGESFT